MRCGILPLSQQMDKYIFSSLIEISKQKKVIYFGFVFSQASPAEGKCGLPRYKPRIHLHVHIEIRV